MATRSRTPSPARAGRTSGRSSLSSSSEEERPLTEKQRYRKNVTALLKGVEDTFRALIKLNRKLYSLKQGQQLKFTVYTVASEPGQRRAVSPDEAFEGPETSRRLRSGVTKVEVMVDKKMLNEANMEFKDKIASMKEFMLEAKKTERPKQPPESFKGSYKPVFTGEAIRYLMVNANFGQTADGRNLMDQLELARNGYFLMNTSTILMHIHINVERLADQPNGSVYHPSAAMNEAFGGSIASLYRQRRVGTTGKNGKPIFKKYLNTDPSFNSYIAAQENHPEFLQRETGGRIEKPEGYLKISDLKILVNALNTYADGDLPEAEGSSVRGFLDNPDTRDRLLQEFFLVDSVRKMWTVRNEPRQQQKKEEQKLKRAQAGSRGTTPRGRGVRSPVLIPSRLAGGR